MVYLFKYELIYSALSTYQFFINLNEFKCMTYTFYLNVSIIYIITSVKNLIIQIHPSIQAVLYDNSSDHISTKQ